MMSDHDIQYEIVTTVDTESLIELYKAGGWWHETEETRKRLPEMVRRSFCFIIALHRGKVVGMGRVISDGVSDAYIQDVIVKEEYRKHGIGRELIKRLTQVCLDNQLEWIGLIASSRTIEFYKHLGFRPLSGFIPMLLEQNS